MKRLIQFLIFSFLISSLLILSCKKEEPESIDTDLYVTSSESIIIWDNANDLEQQLNNALSFNYGKAKQNEIKKTIIYDTDTTQVVVTINFKEEFKNKYYDPNLSNNTTTIDLQKFSNTYDVSSNAIATSLMQDMSCIIRENLPNFNFNQEGNVCIPITFHAHNNLNITTTDIDNYLSKLNNYFNNSKISFTRSDYIRHNNNDLYFVPYTGIDFENSNNFNDVENTINVYIFNILAYYYNNTYNIINGKAHFPIQHINRIYLSKLAFNEDIDPKGKIIAHEFGHFFSLYHTFETDANCNNYTQDCTTTGDGICSTPIDEYNPHNNSPTAEEYYISISGNSCNSSNSDIINNLMSYSMVVSNLRRNCDSWFTMEQKIRMRYAAKRWKANLVCQSTPGTSSIQIIPSSLNFPDTQINTTSSQQSFTVTNTGTSSFSITGFNVPPGFTLVNGQSTTINPNYSLTFYVTFNPTNVQNYSGVLEVINTADNASSSTSTVYLSGNGVNNNTSNISLSGNLNFGNLPIGQTDTRTFTISNTGNQSFYVSSINFPYSVYSANWNSGTINPNSSQTVTVTFQPTNQQSYNGNVTVISNATSGNNTIQISGTGVNNNTGQPNLVYSDYRIVSDHNNNNGIVEAREDIDFDIEVHNIGNADAHNVDVYFDTNNPYINITDHSQGYGTVSQSSYDWNSGNLDFEVDPNCPSGPVYFTAHFTSDEGSWYSNFSIDVQAQSGNNPIPITPTNSCYDAPTLDINTEYIVNLDLSDGTIGYAPPIHGVSYNGADVQGFWLKFYEPAGYVGPLNIKIYDVSSNFDPVIGRKFSCSSIYYTQWNSTSYVANDNSYGGSETFADYANNNGYTYRIRIYHYYGYEQNNISFKIKIERP